MAPAKRSKSVNKVFAGAGDFSPGKDDKCRQKKRKLSDMLGPQWSKHELVRFYEAYRKYGHDWKKVAIFVGSRTINMVEALYNINRAYLSLPDGTASVAGLIAMMTDHYNNVMGGNGIEKGGSEPLPMSRKIQKHPKPKGWLDNPREDSFRQQSTASDKGLSLLKLRLDSVQPSFPVRKRTPRVAVSSSDAHPNKSSRESVMNKNQDAVSHGSFLTRAWKTPSSLQVSQSSYYEYDKCIKSSEVLTRENVLSQFEMARTKHSGTAMDEESAEDSLGISKPKNGGLIRDSLYSSKSAGAEFRKGKIKVKKEEVGCNEAELFDHFANRGHRGKVGSEGTDAKTLSTPSDSPRQTNKKSMLEDERAACDALQTLAEMSLMMTYLSAEDVKYGEESITGLETTIDSNSQSDAMLKDKVADGESKKKRKFHVLKVPKAGLRSDHSRKLAENEALTGEEAKSADSSGHISTVTKRYKSSVRSPDAFSGNDQQIREADVATSSEFPRDTPIANSTRRKHHRKRDKTFLLKDRNVAHITCSSECSSLLQDSVHCVKEKISNCLSCHDVHKWCVYEWFYSAIDYPWFAKREFVEYLNHVGLGHIPRLTRVEWGVIRSSLGKPRRFSEHFLLEEREKLKQYRESVRTHYANLRAGIGEGLPTDLARPLSVGQQVVAIHPKTREVQNGSVLTVDRHICLVQFNRPDLGVESVMDIDCMPVNPLENMPEALRMQKMAFDCRYVQSPKVNEQFMTVSEEHVQNFCAPSPCSSFADETKIKPACTSFYPHITTIEGLKIPSTSQSRSYDVDQMNPKKGDMKTIPGLTQRLCRQGLEQHSGPSNTSCWPQPMAISVGLNGAILSSSNSMLNCQETASNMAEIVDRSRDTAQKMVEIAIKAISLMEEGEDAFGKIGEALDATDGVQCATTCRVPTLTSSNAVQSSLRHRSSSIPFTFEQQTTDDPSGIKPTSDSAACDPQIPSDLIASCVATLFMIQTCTERQCPPAEVAQILDNAVTSLHPRCSQNLGVYREIQMCMGRIKTQILALVPS